MQRIIILTLTLLTLAPAHAEERTTAINPMRVNPAEYLDKLTLPAGFNISLFATGVTGARSMSISPSGTVYVGTFTEWGKDPYGKVYAVEDTDKDNIADKVSVIATGLNHPNGVAFKDGSLYVAEINRILRYDNIEANLDSPPKPVIVNDSYPDDFHHGWKFIRFGPDDKLYIPVGAPCNICEVNDPYASITRMNKDGSDVEVFARGIRNSVGFDWHPEDKSLWFTDNGRDLMGNDMPPEELNHAPTAGLHFGFPYRYGKTLVDPAYPSKKTAPDFQAAALEMPAHSAALGLRFYTGNMFPETYKHAIIMAQHGSWNRHPPQGYRVAVAKIKDNKVIAYDYLAEGWLQNEKFWGRPVDIGILADGSVLVSDDFNGVIYRISYTDT